MKLLIILCLWIIALGSQAQTDFTKDYHPFIYKAEIAILKEDYMGALRFYQFAFQNVQKPFSRDLLNAAVCAAKASEFSLSFRFCDSLIAKGVKKAFFNNYSGFAILRASQNWNEYIAQYNKKFKQFRLDKDTTLAMVFRDMHRRDQEFRTKPGSYQLYGDTIRKIDSTNVLRMRNIISTKGFPNENMISSGDPLAINFPAYIVLHHYMNLLSRTRNSQNVFLQDMVNAVKSGQLDPHRFAFLISLQGEKSITLGGFGLVACKYGEVQSKLMADLYTENQLALIEESRPIYGLEPLQAYYEKALFALRSEKSKEFSFDVYKQLNTFVMNTAEECENFKKGSLMIEK